MVPGLGDQGRLLGGDNTELRSEGCTMGREWVLGRRNSMCKGLVVGRNWYT